MQFGMIGGDKKVVSKLAPIFDSHSQAIDEQSGAGLRLDVYAGE